MNSFTILTLNCFGVPMPSTRRRLFALSRVLNDLDADVVCLQEVQANPYRRLLLKACTGYLYHSYRSFVHAPKGGLLTLSRHPIHQSRFTLYNERGLWYTPAIADWILHKGILVSHIQYGDLPIVVMNTHLTANYTGDWSPANRFALHEWEQLQQLAGLVHTQPEECLVLVTGDFNIPRGSWLSEQFLAKSGLTDALAGDLRPTFRPLSGMPARYAAPIDFILFRAPDSIKGSLTIESCLMFEEKHQAEGGQRFYLSDHKGIKLRLLWQGK